MFWIFIIAIGLSWVAQSALSFKQAKAFSTLFVDMRRRGRVAMGKFRGGIVQGAIVMFGLDDDGVILEGQRLHGVSVVARFRPFEDFTGEHISDVDPAVAARFGKSVVKAVANAKDNYRIILSGEKAPEPPTALARTIDAISAKFRRRRPAPIAG